MLLTNQQGGLPGLGCSTGRCPPPVVNLLHDKSGIATVQRHPVSLTKVQRDVAIHVLSDVAH